MKYLLKILKDFSSVFEDILVTIKRAFFGFFISLFLGSLLGLFAGLFAASMMSRPIVTILVGMPLHG